jgi:peroxiredoxin Q/BCP
MNEALKVGDRAPDFTLPAQDGRIISLHDYVGKKNLVIYFYPKDFTIGCTAETKTFGENYDELRSIGAEVIGISSDTADSHGRFAEECGAKFPLLADEGGRVRQEYRVKSTLGMLSGRVTFVVDKQGIVRHVFSSQLRPKEHVSEAVRALRNLPS